MAFPAATSLRFDERLRSERRLQLLPPQTTLAPHPMKSVLLLLGGTLLSLVLDSPGLAAAATVPLQPIRAGVIISRTPSLWESQQVQEPCILPNPKDPAPLVMIYSGVPAPNRNLV